MKHLAPRGFIALISSIIISTVLLGLATAIGQNTFFSRFDVLNSEYKRISLGLAEACSNAALAKIGTNYNYTTLTDPAYNASRGGAVVSLGTTYGIPVDCVIKSPSVSPVEDASHKRTFSITTVSQFFGAWSTVNVSAIVQNPATAPVVPAPSCVLQITPASLPLGQSATVQWSTSANAASFSIDHGIGSVGLSGPPWQTLTPTGIGAITYTGTVANAGGSNPCTATITVTAPPPAPSCADTVMVFDRTGSMSSSDLSSERTAGNGLISLYSGVASQPQLSVGSFGGLNGTGAWIPTGSPNGLLTNIYSNITTALNQITSSNSSVGSDLGAAITVGDNELGSVRHIATKQKVLIFVSDGVPNRPSSVTGSTATSSPTANVQNGSGDAWTNPTNAYASGGSDASDTGNHRHRFYNFNFPSFPSGSTITGIMAAADAWSTVVPATLQSILAPSGITQYDQWSANTGTRVSAVATNDGDTSYIDTTTSTETFVVSGAGVPAGATITSVTLNASARATASGPTLALVVENGGAPNVGPTNTLTTSYATYSRTMTTNPLTGSAWTLAEVNAWSTRFGVQTGTSASFARVSQVWVTVSYTLPASTTFAPSALGNYDQWTAHPTNSSATRVNYVATNDADSTYLDASSNGQSETYNISSGTLPAGATITNVSYDVVARGTSNSATMKMRVENGTGGGQQSDDLFSTTLSTSYQTYTRSMNTNPLTGSAWTLSTLSSTRFGLVRTNSSGGTPRLTEEDVTVSYTTTGTTGNLSPVAVGGYDQWSANTGTRVSAVATNDGDTSYIDKSTSTETFTVPGSAIPAGSTINSVTINAVARGTTGSTNLALVVENGGAPNVGPTNTLTTSYATYSRTMTTNPLTGSAWTLAEVNAWSTRFGVRTNNGAISPRVTQISVVVSYTTSGVSSGCQLGVDLSWNGGTNWTSEKVVTIGATSATYTFGNPTDLWSGHTWTLGDFSNTNFRARVHDINPGGSCAAAALAHLDWLRFKVFYSQPADPYGFAAAAAATAKNNGVNIFTIHYGDVSGQNFLGSLASASSIAASAISTAVRSGNVVTITTPTPHHLVAKERVTISGVSNTAFNGTFMITSVPTANSFTYAQTAGNTSSTGGTVSPSNLFIAPTASSIAGIFQSIGYQICPAAAPSCSNTIDDDGDGLVDENDSGCHTDGTATNPASYDPLDNDEWSAPPVPPAPPPPPPPPNIIIGAWQEVP